MPIKNLTYGGERRAAGSSVKQEVTLTVGHSYREGERHRQEDQGQRPSLKVQAAIQGDLVRISGKDRDTLQQVMQLLKNADFSIDLQFTNYRTN